MLLLLLYIVAVVVSAHWIHPKIQCLGWNQMLHKQSTHFCHTGTSQDPISCLKTDAPLNIPLMSVKLETSHDSIYSLNVLSSLNTADISRTWETSHLSIRCSTSMQGMCKEWRKVGINYALTTPNSCLRYRCRHIKCRNEPSQQHQWNETLEVWVHGSKNMERKAKHTIIFPLKWQILTLVAWIETNQSRRINVMATSAAPAARVIEVAIE